MTTQCILPLFGTSMVQSINSTTDHIQNFTFHCVPVANYHDKYKNWRLFVLLDQTGKVNGVYAIVQSEGNYLFFFRLLFG